MIQQEVCDNRDNIRHTRENLPNHFKYIYPKKTKDFLHAFH